MRAFNRAGLTGLLLAAVLATPATAATPSMVKPPEPQKATPHRVSPLASEKGRGVAEHARSRWEKSQENGRAALAEQRAARSRVVIKPAMSFRTTATSVTQGKPGNGDYSATPLSPSSSWEAGSSSGSFNWSYPLPGPPSVAGPAPQLSINYDSGSVDGRTSTSNNQTSVLGEGFDLNTSYVERTYLSCHDDGHTSSFDLCWRGEQLRFVLNGQSAELVPISADEFRLKSDDGTVIKRSTGASNGDNNGEYWIATTPDGTKYTFGRNRLPGWTAGADETDSTWTVPVFSDDVSDPAQADACRQSTFDDSWCQQAWRWNLDLVEDRNDNAATFWYAKESNNYARNGHESASASYDRGGYLQRVDYGLRASALFNGAATAIAPQRLALTYAERCLAASCASLTNATKYDWPDVPFDSICAQGDTCTDDLAPTFFTRKRLTEVKATIGDAAGRRDVDSWTVDHIWVDPGDVGDTTDQVLWPSSIQHTGLAGPTPITERALKLTPSNNESLRNRVDSPTDGIAPLIRPRLSEVITEAGAVIDISYSPIDCAPGNLPASPATNTRRCFPTFWAPYGGDPTIDWFHKYVATNVMLIDTTTGETVDTAYVYGNEDGTSNDAAWHYDANPNLADAYRTWSQWRGYQRVVTLTGVATAPERAASVRTFYRGMDGDRDASGGTKSATVAGIQGASVADDDQYTGLARESITYQGRTLAGAYGPVVNGSISTPWSQLTASATYPQETLDGKTASAVTVRSHKVRDDVQANWTRVMPSGSPASVRSIVTDVATYDSYGLPLTVDQYVLNNETAAPSERRCTQTWYARTTGVGIVNLVSRSRVVSRSCADAGNAVLPATTGATTSDVLTDTAAVFDGSAAWDNPTLTRGNVTKALRATNYAGGAPTWQTVTTSGYDSLGRVTSVANANQVTNTTEFTPAGAGLADKVKVTNSKGWASTTTVEPSRLSELSTVDINGKLTEKTYDALGRLTQVWTPIALRSLGAEPVYKFEYHPGGAPTANGFIEGSWAATSSPKGNTQQHIVSYEIFDALQRPRQTQLPSAQGGRLLTDTIYNDRGLVSRTLGDVWDNTTAPNGTRQLVTPGQAVQTDTAYDGANRPTTVTTSWSTPTGRTSQSGTTTYTGDSVATAPPAGASASRVITDALGRTTENRTYSGSSPDGTFLTSKSTYDNRGLLSSLVGPDSTITYNYDALGRQTRTVDPDRGVTTSVYDGLDRVVQTTDAMARTISTAYDELDRQTATYKGAVGTGTLLSEWKYDTPALGQVSSSTRYTNGLPYTRQVLTYDGLYRATKTRLSLPASDPLVTDGPTGVKVPATLDVSAAYNRDGTLLSTSEPAVAGLPSEVLSRTYTDLGQPKAMSGTSGVVLATSYNQFGDPTLTTLGVSAANTNRVWLANTFDGLRRPATTQSTETNGTNHLLDLAYTYDTAGKITKIADASPASGGPDYQCFLYDGYQRLATAWTPTTNDCAAARTLANIDTTGGPYWHDYTYKPSGLRDRQTIHAVVSGQVDKIVTSTYGGLCGTQALGPHVLNKTVTTNPAGATTDTDAYCANAAGETTAAETPSGAPLTLGWNEEGRLQNVQRGTVEFTNVYDADGNLLIRRPAAGTAGLTTLYVGATEVQVTKTINAGVASFTAKGLRYYTHNGATVAARTGSPGTTSKLTFQAADHHGTTSAQWDALAPATRTKRYTDPFGATRGTDPTTPAWADDKRFLGMPNDTTNGLTHIGARDYMPELGRFLSVDPILDGSDPQSLNGYSYSNNNPINMSDPSGLAAINMIDPDAMNSGHSLPSSTSSSSSSSPGSSTPTHAQSGQELWEGSVTLANVYGSNCDAACMYEQRSEWHIAMGVVEYSGVPSLARDVNAGVERTMNSKAVVVARAVTVDDALNCYNGSVSGCAAVVANMAAAFIPGGQIKYLENLDDIQDAIRGARVAKRASKAGPGAWGPAAESMSGRAAAYQARVAGGAAGSVYRVGGVKFDGFANGVLQEAKGPGYAKFVRNGQFKPWFSGADGLASQAQRQLAAAGGTPITWSVAEAEAATAINNLFMSRGISGINVSYVP
jgi:RHS repeat-associated protein